LIQNSEFLIFGKSKPHAGNFKSSYQKIFSQQRIKKISPTEGWNKDQIFRQITGSAPTRPYFRGDKKDVGPI
jgi:hypothetical protein